MADMHGPKAPRPDYLRPLAVTVEEPQTGVFAWALLERHGSGWTTVDEARARAVRPTYREAMADGLLALQQRVDDLDAGPRMEAGRSGDKAATHNAEEAEMEESGAGSGSTRSSGKEAAHAVKRLFGFGPLV